jgi:Mg2+ and Co2+ transporter CorA
VVLEWGAFVAVQFAKLVIGDEKRAVLQRDERLVQSHDLVMHLLDQIDHSARLVEKAAADLVEASVEAAANERADMAEPPGWTIGL